MGVLTQNRFLHVQGIFYNKVITSPRSITLRIYSITSTGNVIDDFVGDSTRTYIDYTLPALFTHSVEEYQREDFGLTNIEDGEIFISPTQLLNLGLSTYIINPQKTIIIMDNHEYQIGSINYLERLFGSCIAVQINLKDAIRG